jgi:O-antigen ligase
MSLFTKPQDREIKIINFLWLTLLTILPFNIRSVLNFDQIKNIEGFREHISYSIYALDVVFFLLLLALTVSNLNNIIKRLANKEITLKKLREIPFPNRQSGEFKPLVIAFFILIAVLISSLLSGNRPSSCYATLRIAEAFLFFFIAKNLLKNTSLFQLSIIVIFFSGIIQAVIAVLQFIFQRSVGLYFLGESRLSSEMFNVAKIEFYGEKILRPYGTLPHTNLLGAFLLLAFVCGIYLIKNTRHKIINCRSLIPIIIALIISFSRSVWFVFFLFIIIFFFLAIFENPNYWFVLVDKIKKIKLRQIIIALFSFVLVFLILSPRLCINNCPNDPSRKLRTIYSGIALKSIYSHPFFGIGPGNFTYLFYSDGYSSGISTWDIQPVHNLYLLIASEIGLPGLILFLLFIFLNLKLAGLAFLQNLKPTTNKNSLNKHPLDKKFSFKKMTDNLFYSLFLGFLLLGLFDHYFWTLLQGQIIFWLALALTVNIPTKNSQKNLVKDKQPLAFLF